MLRVLVFLALTCLFRSAFAVVDYSPIKWQWDASSPKFAAAADACQAAAPLMGYTYDTVVVSGGIPNQSGTCKGHNVNISNVAYISVAQVCPTGMNWNTTRLRCEGTVSQCPSGKQPVSGYCEPIPPCTANQTVGSGYILQGTDPNRIASLQCSGQCEVVFDGFISAGSTLVNGVKTYYALGSLITTGDTCTQGSIVAAAPATSVPAPSCASDQVLGTVNGAPVCAKKSGTDAGIAQAPSASASQSSTSHTTTNPDGTTTTTTTDTSSVKNSDGSTGTSTTTTTKTCDTAGNCTASTDTTTTGAYKPPGEQQSECELHPDTVACAKLDVPDTPDMPGETVHVNVVPQSGWGADNGTCPGLVHTVSVGNVDVFGLFCQYAAGIRFAVIGFAGIMGVLIFLGRTD